MLISILVALILIALCYWVITYLPLPPLVKQIATVILVVVVVLWIINLFAPGTVPAVRLN